MIKTYSQAKTIVENKFLTSSYIKSRNISAKIKYTPEEIHYWATKIVNSNWSESFFVSEFDKVYSATQETNLSQFRYNDHIGQTFLIDSNSYPNGLFLSSIGVFFSSIDDQTPITLDLRKIINGTPSKDIIPLSIVTIKPLAGLAEALPPLTVSSATLFTFLFPVYLDPGYYCFTLSTNSSKYNLYIAERGLSELGSNKTVTNPYIGSLITSQQGEFWSNEQTKDLCFILNRAKFNIGTQSFNLNTDKDLFNFNTMNLKLYTQEFGEISYIKDITATTVTAETNETVITPIAPNKNVDLSVVATANTVGGANFSISMTNNTDELSPMIDLERSGSILVSNYICGYAESISDSELTPNDGFAAAKYITKQITLNDEFDADGLTVYLDSNKPNGTEIEVFYKILNKYDYTTPFKDLPWNRLTRTTQSLIATNTVDYSEETFQNLNITYSDQNGTLYKDFKYFAVKIVMYSTNPCFVPKIKNLRAIATV
jgi:hypothetical protein